MHGFEENLERLTVGGLIVPDAEITEEAKAVVEGMTPDEVDVLIGIRRRLDEAERVSEINAATWLFPP